MLSRAEIVRRLLSVELLDGREVLDGGLWIDEVPRKNSGSKIQTSGGPCYFIKQGFDAEGEVSVAREAAAYRRLASLALPAALERALPRFYGYDESNGLLVLGLSPGSISLAEFHAQHGRIPNGAAVAIGRALAALHQLPPSVVAAAPDSEETPPPAWPLSLHRPSARILHNASGANLELVRMIQEFPEFCLLLDALHARWRPVSLIHFDLKADNCVLAPPTNGASRKHEIKIVDWETLGRGDPCWDVGSIFSDYLGLWLLSVPILADTPPERFLGLTRSPLSRMVPAIHSFWSAYVEGLGLTPDETQEVLLLAVRYSGARLLQTAFEQTLTSQSLNGNIICMLQMSWNMLEKPEEATTRLLGLPV